MANLRFYTNNHLALGDSIQLSESAAAHATRALRLNVGDKEIGRASCRERVLVQV